jgi:hypothetical protein
MEKMVEVRAFFSGWHKVTIQQAKKFVKHLLDNANAIKENEKENYINKNHLRGITVKELKGSE